MIDYPSVLPLDCSKNLFEIISNRQLAERKEEFAHCFWNIQGYVQGLLLGPGPAHEAGLFGSGTKTTASRREAAKDDQNLKDIGESLLKLQDQLINDPPQFGAGRDIQAFNWALILQMIPVLIQMLRELGVLKTDVAVPGMFGVAPGDFPEGETQSHKTVTKKEAVKEGSSVGHDGVLTNDCSIDELGLPVSANEALAKAHIKTVGQAIKYQEEHEEGLQSLPGIGQATEDKFDEAVKHLKK